MRSKACCGSPSTVASCGRTSTIADVDIRVQNLPAIADLLSQPSAAQQTDPVGGFASHITHYGNRSVERAHHAVLLAA